MTTAEPIPKTVTVSAPSRLHFGLISIGNLTERRFGSAGLMIDQPRTSITISRSQQPTLPDKRNPAICTAARRWLETLAPEPLRGLGLAELAVEITGKTTGRHRGLGSGTQISFSVAAALNQVFCGVRPSPEELARALDRGKRSAIGSHGFAKGGFLVDRGIDQQGLAPLDAHLAFPESWPIVLIEPATEQNAPVFGEKERAAFSSLPPTTPAQADEMIDLLKQTIVPAVAAMEFDNFAAGITEYGTRSGRYFAPVQGSAFCSPWAEQTVQHVQSIGNYGVGQSSWGPTLFAVCKSIAGANFLIEELSKIHEPSLASRTVLTKADNHGARWTTD